MHWDVIIGTQLIQGGKDMKLDRIIEVGATIGAVTLVGIEALQHKHKEEEAKKARPHNIALYSSLLAVGLALWDIKRHRHAHA